jgi:hypothetical protein
MKTASRPLVLLWLGIVILLTAFLLEAREFSSGMREWFFMLFYYPKYDLPSDVLAFVPIIGFILIFLSAIWLTIIQSGHPTVNKDADHPST